MKAGEGTPEGGTGLYKGLGVRWAWQFGDLPVA